MGNLFITHARQGPEADTPYKKENRLFSQIDNLWEKTSPVSSSDKAESVYMMNRFLSLTPQGFIVASDCNLIVGLPEWAKHILLYYTTPQQRKPWKKYPKMAKVKMPSKKQKALTRICNKFCVKEFHGLQIMAILEDQGYLLEEN